MRPLHFRTSLPMALILVASLGCGSTAPKPTLPAPEFEPPEVMPWDAGIRPEIVAPPDAAVQTSDERSTPEEHLRPQAEPAPTDPGSASSHPVPTSTPLTEPPTSVKIAPTP